MQGLLDSPWKNHTIIRDKGGKKTLSGSCHRHFFKSFAVATEQLFCVKHKLHRGQSALLLGLSVSSATSLERTESAC